MAYADVAASQAKATSDQLANTVNAGTTFNFGNNDKGDQYSNETGQSAKTDASASASLGGNAASAIGGSGSATMIAEIIIIALVGAAVAYFALKHKK